MNTQILSKIQNVFFAQARMYVCVGILVGLFLPATSLFAADDTDEPGQPTASVTINPPPGGDPITPGDTLNVQWSSEGTDECDIRAGGANDGLVNTQPPNGTESIEVPDVSEVTIDITCIDVQPGVDEEATDSVSKPVSAPPDFELNSVSDRLTVGESTPISWSFGIGAPRADTCSGVPSESAEDQSIPTNDGNTDWNDFSASASRAGGISVAPPNPGSATYTLKCIDEDTGQSSKESITLQVEPQPEITEFELNVEENTLNFNAENADVCKAIDGQTYPEYSSWGFNNQSDTTNRSVSLGSISPGADIKYGLVCQGTIPGGSALGNDPQNEELNPFPLNSDSDNPAISYNPDKVIAETSFGSPSVDLVFGDDGNITLGDKSTLSWTSQNAESCQALNGADALNNWNNISGTEGEVEVEPPEAGDQQYEIECESSEGLTATDMVTIDVTAPDAPTVDLTASPSSIEENEATTLSWDSTNANTCSASSDNWSGVNGETNGDVSDISPSSDATYEITCSNEAEESTDTAEVTVESSSEPSPEPQPDPEPEPQPSLNFKAPSINLTADPQQISEGESSTLTWTPQEVSYTDTPIQTCKAKGQNWSGVNGDVNGSTSVSPNTDQTYEIECQSCYIEPDGDEDGTFSQADVVLDVGCIGDIQNTGTSSSAQIITDTATVDVNSSSPSDPEPEPQPDPEPEPEPQPDPEPEPISACSIDYEVTSNPATEESLPDIQGGTGRGCQEKESAVYDTNRLPELGDTDFLQNFYDESYEISSQELVTVAQDITYDVQVTESCTPSECSCDTTEECEGETYTDEEPRSAFDVTPGFTPSNAILGSINRTPSRQKYKYEVCPVAPEITGVEVNPTEITSGQGGFDVEIKTQLDEIGSAVNTRSSYTSFACVDNIDPSRGEVGEDRSVEAKCKNGEGETDTKDGPVLTVYPPACIENFDVRAGRNAAQISANNNGQRAVTGGEELETKWSLNNDFGISCNGSPGGLSGTSSSYESDSIIPPAPSGNPNPNLKENREYSLTCENPLGDTDNDSDNIDVLDRPELNLRATDRLPEASGTRTQVNGNYAVIGNKGEPETPDGNPIELEWSSKNTTFDPGANPNPCQATWTTETGANGTDTFGVDHNAGASSTGTRSYDMTCQNFLDVSVTDSAQITSLPPLSVRCDAFPTVVDNDAQSFMNVVVTSLTSGTGWNYAPFDYLFDRDLVGSFSEDTDESRTDVSETQIREPLNYEFEEVGNRKPEVKVSTDFQQGDQEQVSCGSITNFRGREIREVRP